MSSLLRDQLGLARKDFHAKVIAANTDTQIFLVAWGVPVNATAYLEQLSISNTSAATAWIVLWDKDVKTTGTVPQARGTKDDPVIPPIPISAGSMVNLGSNDCPHPQLTSGLVAQVTGTIGNGGYAALGTATGSVYVYGQWAELEN